MLIFFIQCPVLLYLFYLAQMGITTSVVATAPSAVKAKSVARDDQFLSLKMVGPLSMYHSLGLMVSLSTSQPVQSHVALVSFQYLLF